MRQYTKPKAIIVDLDGTFVNNKHLVIQATTIKHDEYGKWDTWIRSTTDCLPHDWCYDLVSAMHKDNTKIIFLTARVDINNHFAITNEWIQRYFPLASYELIMRTSDEYDKYVGSAPLFKMNKYLSDIRLKYDIVFAIDDTPSVISMWQSIGVPTLYCGTM